MLLFDPLYCFSLEDLKSPETSIVRASCRVKHMRKHSIVLVDDYVELERFTILCTPFVADTLKLDDLKHFQAFSADRIDTNRVCDAAPEGVDILLTRTDTKSSPPSVGCTAPPLHLHLLLLLLFLTHHSITAFAFFLP